MRPQSISQRRNQLSGKIRARTHKSGLLSEVLFEVCFAPDSDWNAAIARGLDVEQRWRPCRPYGLDTLFHLEDHQP